VRDVKELDLGRKKKKKKRLFFFKEKM